MFLDAVIIPPPSHFRVACGRPDNVAAIINSCGEFSHKGAFCNRMGGPACRPTERARPTDRPTGHVRPERGTAAAAYQMQSKRLGNSHDRPCCSAASRQRNIFVGVQITSRTLRARHDGSPRPSESISLGGRTTPVKTGRFNM